MRTIRRGLLLLALLTLVSNFLAQQSSSNVPNLIRCGGALKDAQGAAMFSRIEGVTFLIYGQQDGGAPVWLETQNVATDAAGQYSVLLGNTTATRIAEWPVRATRAAVGVGESGEPGRAAACLAGQRALRDEGDWSWQVGRTRTAATFNATGHYDLSSAPMLGISNSQGLILGLGGAYQNNAANYNTFICYASDTPRIPKTKFVLCAARATRLQKHFCCKKLGTLQWEERDHLILIRSDPLDPRSCLLLDWWNTKRSMSSSFEPDLSNKRWTLCGTAVSEKLKISAPFMKRLSSLRTFPPSASDSTAPSAVRGFRMPPAGTIRFGLSGHARPQICPELEHLHAKLQIRFSLGP
jgi:hypothetical protein